MLLLTDSALKNPTVSNALEKLSNLEPFSEPFNRLKEALKDHLAGKMDKDAQDWGTYWDLEQAIMTYLFGEGHA